MSEADLFRQYAKEAIHGSSKATNENEKRSLIELACSWAQAALLSERVLGPSFIASPRDVGEATSVGRFLIRRLTSVLIPDLRLVAQNDIQQ